MPNSASKKISLMDKGQILLKIKDEESLDQYFSRLSAIQLKDLRDFLEEEVVYLTKIHNNGGISKTKIKNEYESVDAYFHRQDCREPYESCANETCYTTNPICFGRKMESHIEKLIKLIKSYLDKS